MTDLQDFIKNDELVIFTNAYFVFKFIENLKITGKYSKNISYSNPVSASEFNFFSNNQIEKLSKKIFIEDLETNNTQFRECLKNMYTKNKDFKPAFFHYNLQIHSTSVFINYKKGFIVFFNSSRTSYYLEILKDICIYLNLVKSRLLKELDLSNRCFKVYIINSGKQIDDSFCFIYTNIFLKQLLNSKKEVIDDAESVIEVCNSITKKDACQFIYEEVYLKNKKFLDKEFFNRENDAIYKEFIRLRAEFNDLEGVSCKTGKCFSSPKSKLVAKKPKTPYKIFKANISFNQFYQSFDVCFEKVSHTYALKNFDLIQIQEGFKCETGRCIEIKDKEEDESFKTENHRNKRIINFFDYEKRFVQDFSQDFSFEYNLKEFATKKLTEKQKLYYRILQESNEESTTDIPVQLHKNKEGLFNRISFEKKSQKKSEIFVLTEKVIKNVCTYIYFFADHFKFPLLIDKTKVELQKDGQFVVEKLGLKFYVSKFSTI